MGEAPQHFQLITCKTASHFSPAKQAFVTEGLDIGNQFPHGLPEDPSWPGNVAEGLDIGACYASSFLPVCICIFTSLSI